jgi:hypothetical protein
MNKPTIYLDTSFISLLVARPSRDILTAQRQHYSRLWWDLHRQNYTLIKSHLVTTECEQGDAEMASQRLAILDAATPVDPPHTAVESLQHSLIVPAGPLPKKASLDALHLAIAAVGRCEYLLTWNFTHLVNPQIRRSADSIIRKSGYEPASIITPDQDVESART